MSDIIYLHQKAFCIQLLDMKRRVRNWIASMYSICQNPCQTSQYIEKFYLCIVNLFHMYSRFTIPNDTYSRKSSHKFWFLKILNLSTKNIIHKKDLTRILLTAKVFYLIFTESCFCMPLVFCHLHSPFVHGDPRTWSNKDGNLMILCV